VKVTKDPRTCETSVIDRGPWPVVGGLPFMDGYSVSALVQARSEAQGVCQ
jgi:hypothetical protein